jgi:hypothetical protein
MTEQHSMFVRLRERVTEIFHELQDSRPELTPNQTAAIALERAQAEIMSSNEKPPTANAATPAPAAPAATKTVPLSHEGRGDSTRPPTAAAAAQSVATTAADRLPPSRSPTPPAAAATTPAGDWRFINGNPRNLEKLVALGVSSLGALISVVAAAIATDDSALPPPPWPSAAAAATAGVVVEIELLKVLAFAGSAGRGWQQAATRGDVVIRGDRLRWSGRICRHKGAGCVMASWHSLIPDPGKVVSLPPW